MALTVIEASDRYANFMVTPAPPGPGVCPRCRGFPTEGYTVCHGCSFNPNHLDAFAAITYSIHLEQMHTELRGYKEDEYPASVRSHFGVGLTAVLWRFLAVHEACIARAAGVKAFDRVVTVPSSSPVRDDRPGGLRKIVELCGPIRDRYVRALVPADVGVPGRDFDPRRYVAREDLSGAAVLLVDDTWTSGGHAQSAAHALREAGARAVACVVIGRHVHRKFAATGEVVKHLPAFSWDTCMLHTP